MRTKILLLFAIFFCVALASNAQINAGKYLTGGSFNIYSNKNPQPNNNFKNKSLYTNIQLGKVVKENNVVGVILSYNYYNNYYNNNQDAKNTQYSAGVFYRKYKRLIKDLYFFGEVDALYHHWESTPGYTQNGNYFSKAISNGGLAYFIPGISYAVCKRFQIELLMPNIIGISYSHTKTDYVNTPAPPSSGEGNSFSFNTNLNANLLNSFGIGFKFLLGK